MDRKERNNIAKSIVNSHNREEVKRILNSAVHGGMNFTSGDFSVPSVSANIGNYWLNHNELWDAFTRTKYSKFFCVGDYTGAHSWTKKGTEPKEIQDLELSPREITTSYQYKRQQITQEDLDAIAARITSDASSAFNHTSCANDSNRVFLAVVALIISSRNATMLD